MIRVSRRVLRGAAALLVLALVPAASAQLSTVPTDIQLPGSQPNEVLEVLDAEINCLACHGQYDEEVEPYHNWQGSMMSQSARDPLFWAAVAVAEQDFAGSGDLCIRCHVPRGWLADRSTPTDGSSLEATGADAHGVSCDFCHRLTNPDTSEWTGEQYSPFLAHDGGVTPEGYYGSGMYVLQNAWEPRFGPYDDAAALHLAEQSLFHRSPDLCGTCHDVSNPAVGDLAPGNGHHVPLAGGTYSGTPGTSVAGKAAFNNSPYQYGIVERTYSEHQASAFATLAVSDFATLPADLQQGAIRTAYVAALGAGTGGDYADGTTRTFSCQTCHMPPKAGEGCALPFAPSRTDVPAHHMNGANTWTPLAIEYLDEQDKLVMGDDQLSDLDYDALFEGVTRSRNNLRRAAALSLDGNTLTVVNLTGHKLISGYPEGRRMWINVRWYGGNGVGLLREDGAYGKLTVDIDGTPTTVRSLLDLSGTNTRIYQIKLGMTQEWADDLIGLGWSSSLPLAYDRITGAVDVTLGDLSSSSPGTVQETFHFVLNDTIISDTRIPPYGMSYDEAQTRGALPIPDTQYGDPGPGGTYDYKDIIELDPPTGAVTGIISLYYQTTSWEYVQFLHEANDGSISHLSTTGDDLLEAWLETGMSKPELMEQIAWPGGDARVQDPPPTRGDPTTRPPVVGGPGN